MMKAGINLGIGTDGAASNDKLDMLGETRLAAMLAKAVAGATTCAKVFDMLEAATLGGARALHWDDEIGSLEIGKCADMIAVDLSGIECGPVTDPAAQLLYSAGREHVTHVWVAGRLAAGEGTEPRDDTARTLLEKWAPPHLSPRAVTAATRRFFSLPDKSALGVIRDVQRWKSLRKSDRMNLDI